MRLIGLAVFLTVSLILAPLAVEAQQAANIPRIGKFEAFPGVVVSREVRQARARSRPVAANYGSFLLPRGAPEGCPTHYGAGHATVAAACVTILKAFVRRVLRVPQPRRARWLGAA